jgi:hypothetical protein
VLNVRQPQTVGLPVSADRERVAAVIVGAIYQQAMDAHFARFAHRDFLFAPHLKASFTRLIDGCSGFLILIQWSQRPAL